MLFAWVFSQLRAQRFGDPFQRMEREALTSTTSPGRANSLTAWAAVSTSAISTTLLQSAAPRRGRRFRRPAGQWRKLVQMQFRRAPADFDVGGAGATRPIRPCRPARRRAGPRRAVRARFARRPAWNRRWRCKHRPGRGCRRAGIIAGAFWPGRRRRGRARSPRRSSPISAPTASASKALVT